MNIFKEEIDFSLKDKIIQLMQDLFPDFTEEQWEELERDLTIIFVHDTEGDGAWITPEAYQTAFNKWFKPEKTNHSQRYFQEKAQQIMQLFEEMHVQIDWSDTIHYQSPGVYAPQVLEILQKNHELPSNINGLLVGAQTISSIEETLTLLRNLNTNFTLTVSDITGEETVDYIEDLNSTQVQFLLEDILNPSPLEEEHNLILTSNLLNNLVAETDSGLKADPIVIAIKNMVEKLEQDGVLIMQESSSFLILNMVKQALESLGNTIKFKIYEAPLGFRHRSFLDKWVDTGEINPNGVSEGSQYERKMVVIEVVKI
jgi:hypothetical protein